MPRHRKKKSTAPKVSAPITSAPKCSALSQFMIPDLALEAPSPPARDLSSITVHASVYQGGYVCYSSSGSKEIFQSIVCKNDYAHLSPEVSQICTVESISRILRAMCVGVALPRSGDKYGSCSLGSTFVRGAYQQFVFCPMLHIATTFVPTTQEARLRYHLDVGRTSTPSIWSTNFSIRVLCLFRC